jgi:hypothetical protein
MTEMTWDLGGMQYSSSRERSKLNEGFISSLTSSCPAKPLSSVHLLITSASGGIKSFAFVYGEANRRDGMRKRNQTHLEMALDMRYGKPIGAHELENELGRSLCN